MSDYPSVDAMKAAVELEIQACIGRVQTVAIGQAIQGVLDKQREEFAEVAESMGNSHIADAIRMGAVMTPTRSTITPALDAAIQDEIEHGPKDIMGSEK